MKYLCLIYDNEQNWDRLPKAEVDAVMAGYHKFSEDLVTSGKMISGEALEPVHTATTVRVRDGKTITTDGPFAETKEQLGGYYLVEAVDLNDAIQIAARIPSAAMGCVEVRPIMSFDMP